MKLKKVISALLVMTMTASLLAGCGGKTEDAPAATEDTSADTAQTEEAEPAADAEEEPAQVEEQVLKVAAFEGGYGADMWSEVVEIGRAHV